MLDRSIVQRDPCWGAASDRSPLAACLAAGVSVLLAYLLLAAMDWRPAAGGGSTPEAPPMLIETDVSEALLDSARRELYAYRMADAERLLHQLERRPDGRPAAHYYLAMAALHRGLMSDDASHFELFEERSDALAGLLAERDPSAWRDLMEADRRLWHAAVHSRQGRYVRAAWAARSAYTRYERVTATFPDMYDAYFGLGLIHLSIGSMPRSYRFVLDVLGYSGGISRGLGELETAYQRGRVARYEAGMVIALTHVVLHLDGERAVRIAADLLGEMPGSPLAAHVFGFVQLGSARAAAAEEPLREAIRRSETEEYYYDRYLDFYLAEVLFRQDDFEASERYYRRYLERYDGPQLMAMTYLGLGKALELQGRRREAVAAYEQVRSARSFDTDEAARRAAGKLLSTPLLGADSLLVLATNAFDSGRTDRALRLLEALHRDGYGLTADQRAEAAYRMGRIHAAAGQTDTAVEAFERAIDIRGDPLSRWAPWSAFFMGKLYQREGRLDEARSAYEYALSFDGRYDYYQALEQSVRAALEVIDVLEGSGS